jgi:stringent starvation protein B
MTSTRPYLLRAFYDWILANDCTPHLVIDAHDNATIPRRHVVDGRLVLNVSPRAVRDLDFGIERVTLNTRFNGMATFIDVPTVHVRAIYARENGRGIEFGPEDGGSQPESPQRRRPNLKLVE